METATFTDNLGSFIQNSGYSVRLVAQRADMPRTTIRNWVQGRVRKPQQWQDILKVANGLGLTEEETDKLLTSAQHPPIAELRKQAVSKETAVLLQNWPDNRHVPFQVLADLPYFVGREPLIEQISNQLIEGRQMAFYGLRGMGGIGKTTLAVHLAYRLRSYFPDGVLWARLDSTDTMNILGNIAATFDVDVRHLTTVESRATTVRSLLANKRVLLILDNAEESSQVRPLLPPTTGKTAVILTSRKNLAVMDEMISHELHPFDAQKEESLQLFKHLLSAEQYRRWREELIAVADLLGHLPLAIAIAAGVLKHHTAVSDYLAQLQDEQAQLDALVREDRNVRASFGISYQALPYQLRNVFVALGAFGGTDFSLDAAAYVLAFSVEDAEERLDELCNRSLLTCLGNGRYALHPLLREFALEKQQNSVARQRMVTYYTDFLVKEKTNYPNLNPEYSNLVAALKTAKEIALFSQYLQINLDIFPLWRVKGELEASKQYLSTALQVAIEIQDRKSQAGIGNVLGKTFWLKSEYEAARKHYEQALETARTIDDKHLICTILFNIGGMAHYNEGDYEKAQAIYDEVKGHLEQFDSPTLHYRLNELTAGLFYDKGQWEAAIHHFKKAMEIGEASGQELSTLVVTYQNLAMLHFVKGEFEESRKLYLKALNIVRKIGYRHIESSILAGLSQVLTEQGEFDEALRIGTQALDLSREVGVFDSIGASLLQLGFLALKQSQAEKARSFFLEGLELAERASYRWLKINALLQLGEVHRLLEEYKIAETYYRDSLEMSVDSQLLETMAYSYFGLARVDHPPTKRSVEYAEKGFALFEEMGHFESQLIHEWLEENRDKVI